MSIRQVLTTVLAGTHAAGLMLAQGYGDYYGLRRAPRYIPPYEYSRPYESPSYYGDGVQHPAERDWNRAMRRLQIERGYGEHNRVYRPY